MGKVIYGRHAVLQALNNPRRSFEKLILYRGVQGESIEKILARAQAMGIAIEVVEDKRVFERWVGKGKVAHQGVLLLTRLEEQFTWRDILEHVSGDRSAIVAFLDRIEDPRNLGALVRTAAFFGARGVLVSKAQTAPLNSSALKAAAGGFEVLPVVQVNNFAGVIKEFKEAGVFMIGLEVGEGQPLWDINVREVPVALVVGGEDKGIRKLVRSQCDFLAFIPSGGKLASLNVSVAFGIGMYHLFKQKRCLQ